MACTFSSISRQIVDFQDETQTESSTSRKCNDSNLENPKHDGVSSESSGVIFYALNWLLGALLKRIVTLQQHQNTKITEDKREFRASF